MIDRIFFHQIADRKFVHKKTHSTKWTVPNNAEFPFIFMFFSNIIKLHFQVCFLEGAHGVGVALLVFKVLPVLDAIGGILLLSATCIVPGFLKLTSVGKIYTTSSKPLRVLKFIVDMVACVFQLSAIPLVVLLGYFPSNHFTGENIAIVSVTMVLCSLSWWENYLDNKISTKDVHTSSIMLSIKFDLQESRQVLFMLSSIIKVGVVVLTAYYLQPDALSFDLGEAVDTLQDQSGHITLNTSILVLTLTAAVGYYASYTACKLQMQVLSFTVPHLLATPLAVAVLYMDCREEFLNTVSQEDRLCKIDYSDNWWHLLMGVGWWVSLYWIARHVWFPTQKRLAKIET